MKKKICCLLLGGLVLSSCGLMAACEKADHVIDGIEYTRIPEGIMAMIDDPAITQASPLAEFDGEPVVKVDFWDGTDLEELHLPSSVRELSIKNCPSLRLLELNDGLLKLSSLSGLPALTELTIPASVRKVGTFYNNENGTGGLTVYYEGSVEQMMNMEFSVVGGFGSCKALYVDGELFTDPVVPDGVSAIPAFTFTNMMQLKSITLPSSVTNIGEEAFSGCRALSDIYYQSTTLNWDMIGKGHAWNSNNLPGEERGLLSFTVHCTDGDIEYGPVLPQE